MAFDYLEKHAFVGVRQSDKVELIGHSEECGSVMLVYEVRSSSFYRYPCWQCPSLHTDVLNHIELRTLEGDMQACATNRVARSSSKGPSRSGKEKGEAEMALYIQGLSFELPVGPRATMNNLSSQIDFITKHISEWRNDQLARLSKQPYEVFRLNMTKAKGLGRLQSYLDDFLETGGKETFGKVQTFANEMMRDIVGIGPEDIGQLVGPVLESVFTAKAEEIQEAGEEGVSAWLEKVEPHIQAIQEIFEEIDLLRSRVLLEQAMVTAVTALEVYVEDVTVSAVKLNKFIENRFHKELAKSVDYQTIKDARYDSREAIGLAVVREFRFQEPSDLRDHFRRILNKDVILKARKDREILNRILAYRNVIVHKAGIVDAQFKSRARYRGKLKEPVQLTRRRVENAIRFIEGLVSKVEEEVREARSSKK